MLRDFCVMKAHLKKQYLLQNLKKNAWNLVTGFFPTKAHIKKQYLLEISEKGALTIVMGFLCYESVV